MDDQPLSMERLAARLADALELIVNCDAFAEPFANETKRDPDAEAVRLQRIEDVMAAGRRALAEYEPTLVAHEATPIGAMRDAVVRAAQKWGDTDASDPVSMLAAELELSQALEALAGASGVRASVMHKQGCPAMGGYGHGKEPCICGADGVEGKA